MHNWIFECGECGFRAEVKVTQAGNARDDTAGWICPWCGETEGAGLKTTLAIRREDYAVRGKGDKYA